MTTLLDIELETIRLRLAATRDAVLRSRKAFIASTIASITVSVYRPFGALACAGIAERDLFEPGRHDLMSFVHAKLRGTA